MPKEDVEREIVDELSISDDLDAEFKHQASFFANWGFRHAHAEDEARRAEEDLELVFAGLYRAYKKKYPDSKETEAKSYVKKHKDHKAAMVKFQRAKMVRDIMKIAVRAFEIRRDMLIQLGANRRQEYDGADLSIRKKAKLATKVVKKALKKRRTRRK